MSEPMLMGEATQELTHLRAKYEQFIIERERERILRAFYKQRRELEEIVIGSESFGATDAKWFYQDRIKELDRYIALIKGEQK